MARKVDKARAFVDILKDEIQHIVSTMVIATYDGALTTARHFEESYRTGGQKCPRASILTNHSRVEGGRLATKRPFVSAVQQTTVCDFCNRTRHITKDCY